jgi:hypothetical protein
VDEHFEHVPTFLASVLEKRQGINLPPCDEYVRRDSEPGAGLTEKAAENIADYA